MIAMFIVVGAATKRRLAFPIDKYGALTVVVGLLSFAGVLTYSAGVSYSYTALVAAIVSASPILTVVLAMALLKERPEYSQLFGIAMVIAGLITVSFW
jgi:drug/metabolite transporter (DMT)-like permease